MAELAALPGTGARVAGLVATAAEEETASGMCSKGEEGGTMTEQEYLASSDPAVMLAFVAPSPRHGTSGPLASERKLRLFAVACCRAVWSLLTDKRSCRAVEVAERFADGETTASELELVHQEALEARRCYRFGGPWEAAYATSLVSEVASFDAAHVVYETGRRNIPHATQAALLRDIVGNPFHAPMCGWEADPNGAIWRGDWCITKTVLDLARTIYDDRDYALMPVMADALEESGCEDKAILQHCRGQEPCPRCQGEIFGGPHGWPPGLPCTCKGDGWILLRGPHCRGCHVVDSLLGKE